MAQVRHIPQQENSTPNGNENVPTYYTFHHLSNGYRIKYTEYRDSMDDILQMGLDLSQKLQEPILIRKHTFREHGKERISRIAVCDYPHIR